MMTCECVSGFSLAQCSFLLQPRHSWSGYVTSVSKGDYPDIASANMLPIIDMNPINLSCIYSTLNFIAGLSKELQTFPIVTFDQPLWLSQRNS